MAKMPDETDLGRVLYRPSSPGVSFRAPDYSGIAQAGQAIGRGLSVAAKAMEDVDDYETRRRLIDFKLQNEIDLAESQRNMPAGGAGYTQSWQENYRKRAREFVGKDDANIPESQRGKVGYWLKSIEADLGEKAHRYELAERDREHIDGLETQLGTLRDAVGANPSRRDEMAEHGRKQIELSRIPAAAKHRLLNKYEKELDKVQATARILNLQSEDDMEALREELRLDQEDLPVTIGGVSAKYESGGRGVGFVSSGRGDPGGPSYGVHQLSSKDSMPAFLRSPEGAQYADSFGRARAGTAEFNRIYKRLASEDPEGFAAAQKAFYTRTHYDPLLAHAKAKGFDVTDRGVQEALFSMAIQHGGAKKIVDRAAATGSAEEQVLSLYQNRTRYVSGLRDLPSKTKASVINRYRNEVRDALALVGTSGEGAGIETGSIDPSRPYKNLTLMERKALWGQAQTAWNAKLKELAALDAQERVNNWLTGVEEFNPMSKDGRKLLDDTLALSDIQEKIYGGDLTATTRGVELSQTLRYAPQPIAEGITGLIRSGDQSKMALGYSAVVNLVAKSPNAMDQVPGHESIVKDALKFRLYTNRYGGPQQALAKMAEDADPEKSRLRKIVSTDAQKWVDTEISEDTIRKAMSRGTLADWWNRPELGGTYEDRALMMGEFREVAQREYELTGDKELAMNLATQHLQWRHGVSEVAGKKVMAYPPESFWPPVGGSYDYMAEDMGKIVRTYGPDAVDGSTSLKFADWGPDGKPTYWITWQKEDGRIGMSPRPWVPGYEEADKTSDADWMGRRGDALNAADAEADFWAREQQMLDEASGWMQKPSSRPPGMMRLGGPKPLEPAPATAPVGEPASPPTEPWDMMWQHDIDNAREPYEPALKERPTPRRSRMQAGKN